MLARGADLVANLLAVLFFISLAHFPDRLLLLVRELDLIIAHMLAEDHHIRKVVDHILPDVIRVGLPLFDLLAENVRGLSKIHGIQLIDLRLLVACEERGRAERDLLIADRHHRLSSIDLRAAAGQRGKADCRRKERRRDLLHELTHFSFSSKTPVYFYQTA